MSAVPASSPLSGSAVPSLCLLTKTADMAAAAVAWLWVLMALMMR